MRHRCGLLGVSHRDNSIEAFLIPPRHALVLTKVRLPGGDNELFDDSLPIFGVVDSTRYARRLRPCVVC
jgi:hypothetical protein